MKLKNRFIRMATALAIVGLVASQIPSRPSVSMAADGYPDGGKGLFNNTGAGAVVAGTVLAGAVYGAIVNAGAGASAGGSSVIPAVFNSSKPIYDVTADHPEEFSYVRAIIDTANLATAYKTEEYTVFWPTNAALDAALGTKAIERIIGNRALASDFLNKITVPKRWSIAGLKQLAAKNGSITTLSNDTIQLTEVNGKVLANGAELLSESPASNGWVLSLNGLVSKNFDN